jgi:uncharacterized protein
MRGMLHLFFSLSLWLVDTNAVRAEQDSQPPEANYSIRYAQKIALPDGVQLHATVYLAKDVKAPVIFTLTPYSADSYHARADYFARRGYHFALVDARGRGNSGGKFDPLRQEVNDAAEVVRYFAKQSYGNGQVSMWGGSYAGYNQWLAAAKKPEGLFTIVPVAPPFPGVDFPAIYGVSYPYTLQWLTFTSGALSQGELFGQSDYWQQQALALYRGEVAFIDFDTHVGNALPIFKEWTENAANPKYFEAFRPSDAAIGAIDLPILSITGMYDGDQPGTIAFYRTHMKNATQAARDKHFLVIGPWDHAGTRTPKASMGGLDFGAASMLDMNALHVDWFDYTRGMKPRPEILKDQLAYYMSGSEHWRYAASLDGITGRVERLHFTSPAGNPDALYRAGSLNAEVGRSDVDSYRYDPSRFAEGEREIATEKSPSAANYYLDQQRAQAADGNALIYHSQLMQQDQHIAGFFAADLWLRMNVKDTDLQLSVYAIDANGQSVYLSGEILRARLRDGNNALVEPGKATLYRFRNMTFAARTLKAGSRLRVVLSAPDSIGIQKNFNSGGDIARETIKDAKVAKIELLSGGKTLSTFAVPYAAESTK